MGRARFPGEAQTGKLTGKHSFTYLTNTYKSEVEGHSECK